MQYKVISVEGAEPLSLEEVKTHLRVTEDEDFEELNEDEYIMILIKAAREYCENYTGRALVSQTVEAYPVAGKMTRVIDLPKPPLCSVESFKYRLADGSEKEMEENKDYFVDKDYTPGRIIFAMNPAYQGEELFPVNPLKVLFRAGHSTAPSSVKQAMLLLIGHWYMNREVVKEVVRGSYTAIDFTVRALLAQHRFRWYV